MKISQNDNLQAINTPNNDCNVFKYWVLQKTLT